MAEDKTIKVLVLEDDVIDRKQMERLLKVSTLSLATIYYANCLEDALALLETQPVDVALMDLNLPDSMGLNTIIKTHAHCPQVAIIVTTGEGGEELGLDAVSRGAQDYLVKGEFDASLLSRTIRYACERKRSEEALRESQERYKTLFESATEGILVADIKTQKFNYANPAICKMLGYSMDEIVQMGLKDVHPQKDLKFIVSEFEAQTRGEKTLVHNIPFKCKNRDIIFTDINAARIIINEKPCLVGFITNITERKQQQEQVRRQRDFAESLIETAQVIVLVLDYEGHIIRYNQYMEEISGYQLSEVVGKNWFESFLPEHDRDRIRKVFTTSLEGKKVKGNINAIVTKDGQQRMIEWYDKTMTDAQGKVVGLLATGQDITERIKAEEAMKKANQELAQANQELKEMQMQLVQNEKMASIGQLAAGVAHEMNTPVGFVASNFETLEKYMQKIQTLLDTYNGMIDDIKGCADQALLQHVTEIEKTRQALKIDFILDDMQELFGDSKEGLERVASIVQNLRDFSRIDKAEEFHEFSLNEGIQSTLTVAANEIKYHAEVTTELGDIPSIPCNAGQINQVILNVLVNAAQAIKGQERQEKGSIHIRTFLDDPWVVCEIRDDGPGIPQDILSKIFDPFFTTKTVGNGTGLGLNVSYDIIVNKHKGQLVVDSKQGQGATFIIKLPLTVADNNQGKDRSLEPVDVETACTKPLLE